ncbi:Fth1p SCDLUD_001995 [Saccharomycodes ludwigii]|uniref:Fth1p n=1 Tax=Saccharomycodes ludwigii TaxID=36035 RepID=UPI001E87A60E|nr:hypothetical protein SCDLUD_001995 [Saccharomycodes ludwigii]KAH3902180.1 hypothetical protein SCDLUD_001995 [Saccharomycodes ludwigii]
MSFEFTNYFSFQIFFIFLRESLEIAIIISILLGIVKQSLYQENAEEDDAQLHDSIHRKKDFQQEQNFSDMSSPTELNQLETGEDVQFLSDPGEIINSSQLPDHEIEGQQSPHEIESQQSPHETDTPSASTTKNRENTPGNTFIDRDHLYKKLKVQILTGGALGLLLCMIIGAFFVILFYLIGTDLWSKGEHYYEAVMSILASMIISIMGIFFLRIGKLKEKFRIKLTNAIYSTNTLSNSDNSNHLSRKGMNFGERYSFFILPFITSLREGLEAVVFIGGVGIDQPLTSIPLSMICAVIVSTILGITFYKSSTSFSLKICLIMATCFLYIISAGLFSKGVWQFEVQKYVNRCDGQDMTEMGNGPGSYDIANSVWHVNCCNGERDGLWMVLTAIFGWTNSATYGSVISYNVYWIIMIIAFKFTKIYENHGYIPWIPLNFQKYWIDRKMKHLKNKIKHSKTSTVSIQSNNYDPQPSTSITPLLTST